MKKSARPRKLRQRRHTRLRLAAGDDHFMVERGYSGLSVTDSNARRRFQRRARASFPTKSALVISAVAQFLQHGNRGRRGAGATPRATVRAVIDDLYALYFEEFSYRLEGIGDGGTDRQGARQKASRRRRLSHTPIAASGAARSSAGYAARRAVSLEFASGFCVAWRSLRCGIHARAARKFLAESNDRCCTRACEPAKNR